MSKEIKTGLLVGISIFIVVTGIYFLKGSNIFSSDKNYYAYFDNVDGLVPSAAVQIKGLAIGRVADVQLNGKEKVKVTFTLNHKVQLPEGTTAIISAPDLMSGKVLRLDLGNGTGILPDKATVPARVEPGVLQKVSSQLDPIVANVQSVMVTLDSVVNSVNAMLNAQTRQHIQNSIAAADNITSNFSALSGRLNKESEQLASIIRNTNSITGNISQNNDNITHIVNNLKATTDQLSKAQLDQTVKDLQQTLAETHVLLSKINNGDGTLGMMANDKQLYTNLSSSMSSLDKLLDDLKKHPSRYINIRLFGKAPKD